MKVWGFLICVAITIASVPVSAERMTKARCAKILTDGLTKSEIVILWATDKVLEDGTVPSIRALAAHAATNELFSEWGITRAEWESLLDVPLKGVLLGGDEFAESLDKIKVAGKKLDEARREILEKVGNIAAKARQRLVQKLTAAELQNFAETKTLLGPERVHEKIQEFMGLVINFPALGFADAAAWRDSILEDVEGLEGNIQKAILKAFLVSVQATAEISENDDEVLVRIAEEMGVTAIEIKGYFGEGKAFATIDTMIDEAEAKYASSFKKIINRRFFTAKRREAMLAAIRNSNDVILFKLAENQDLKNFEAVRLLAQSLNAPIIVSPAFSEIGLIPKKLHWLFNTPNVHVMVDRGIQVLRDFYIVDHGYGDKFLNPFTGLQEIYEPTDRVVTFHPRVRALTRATGNYAHQPGYMITTGSMSDPAYWGRFHVSMPTDERAQLEAEMNRSVLILSRRYRSEKYGNLLGSANGIAPRRARYTESRYGNPAGLFDLGVLYTDDGKKIKLRSLPAIILGDIHLGNTDPLFLKAVLNMLERLEIVKKNPRFGTGTVEMEYTQGLVEVGAVILHDLIDGIMNNGHVLDALVTQALLDERGELSLENHIQMAAAWLKQMTQLLPNTRFVVPIDNHGSDWLVKRLQVGDLRRTRAKELPLILKLMRDAIVEKANPYQRIFQYYGVDTDRVLFLGPQETYRVGISLDDKNQWRMLSGVEAGQHGQMGVNGAKSISLQKLLTAYGANVTGHTHASAEWGRSVKVGTGTPVQQGYHRGPSNCDASVALVYSYMAMQLLRMERGLFIPSAPDQRAEEFFPDADYPRMLIRKMPPGGPTTDQYRSDPPTTRYRR